MRRISFFLTSRSLYLVVLSGRAGEPPTRTLITGFKSLAVLHRTPPIVVALNQITRRIHLTLTRSAYGRSSRRIRSVRSHRLRCRR